jgi:Lar family restriction alleviation protein
MTTPPIVYVEEPDVVELKACPFCGGEAKMDPKQRVGVWQAYLVSCRKCAAETTSSRDKDRAIEAWNTRASTPPVTVDGILECCVVSRFEDGDYVRVDAIRAALEAIRNRKGDDRG